MRENFPEALEAVLIHEGGFVDHPKDPGGATNMGITHKTYAAWLRVNGMEQKSVRDITEAEVAAIYSEQYWDAVAGDRLPSGVDYAVFDFAVNSGPSRAVKFLQRVVGVAEDGILGQQTLAAVYGMGARQIVTDLCAARLAWLKRLSHWSTFGRGWERRVNEVKAKAMRLAATVDVIEGREATEPAPGKAGGGESVTSTVKDFLTTGKGWAGTGAVLAPALTAASEGDGPVQWGIAAVLACVGIAVLIWIFRRPEA
jgi:lysozyme family protein